MRFRTGIGVDIHAFTPDGTLGLVLAGVSFPDQRSLAGYSDGDVACHAAADAILSAAGLGDLGELVKPHGAQWEDATGVELLTHAAQVVAEAGFQISNIAVQVVGSRPKIAAVREQAEANLSEAVGAPVSVGGTTSDGLGFTGRDEGLAAIATALVYQTGE